MHARDPDYSPYDEKTKDQNLIQATAALPLVLDPAERISQAYTGHGKAHKANDMLQGQGRTSSMQHALCTHAQSIPILRSHITTQRNKASNQAGGGRGATPLFIGRETSDENDEPWRLPPARRT